MVLWLVGLLAIALLLVGERPAVIFQRWEELLAIALRLERELPAIIGRRQKQLLTIAIALLLLSVRVRAIARILGETFV